MAESMAASCALVAGPGADRDDRAAARPAAGCVHLARRQASRQTRRRSRTRVRRMVEARYRVEGGARLFPGRRRHRRTLLDLSLRRRRGWGDRLPSLVSARNFRMIGSRYVELQCTSHFSFLRGASSCEELFEQAAKLGIEALAVVDRNSLAGIARAHEAARTNGVRLIVGCRLDLDDGPSVLVYPMDRAAYGRLCRLLSLGKQRAGKAKCRLDWSDLVGFSEGLIAVLVPDEADETCA